MEAKKEKDIHHNGHNGGCCGGGLCGGCGFKTWILIGIAVALMGYFIQ